ncbi:TrbL/VirB6 family protein [Rickettsia endosymbiont of Culicoides newsteadi]|uniref:type IV secretion system protein n=1 Tax=Rickettsia endosymbiont of Culicoides newsteadi TaxID=1961830 RepID=UPI000B9C6CBE|nr:type IV secretion system protein [Rickettsia endosymbiont of Culicoides newsteadi]OZG32545.1 type IV secretion system protein VirB6 [Rickettsia endosymbiont of Culicoides newsteadi]
MKGNLSKLIMLLGLIALLVSLVMVVLAMIGSVKITNGCLMRYDDTQGGNTDYITNTVMLNATGNYTVITETNPDGSLNTKYDPNHYGEWLNTNLAVTNGQEIQFSIKGNISLCRAYIPPNNIQQLSDLDSNGNRIAIPRVEETNVEPLSLIFDAKTDEWRNIAELFVNDEVVISILPDQKKLPNMVNVSVKNIFKFVKQDGESKNFIETADCSEGKRKYSPLCGRYSIYYGEYVSGCRWVDGLYNGPSTRHCPSACFFGCMELIGDFCTVAFDCCATYSCPKNGAWVNDMKEAPEPYRDDDFFTSPWSNNVGKLFTDFHPECSHNLNIPSSTCPDVDHSIKDKEYIEGDYQKKRHFWYAAPTGLLYRIDNSGTPSKSPGTGYAFAKINDKDKENDSGNDSKVVNSKYQIIFNDIITATAKSYLQYRFWSKYSDYSQNTGGYVLNIKQTKCRRSNGNSFDDVIENRGRVQYLIMPYGENPNKTSTIYSTTNIQVKDADGNAKITANDTGYLWMRIYNAKEDYKESYGRYKVEFRTSQKVGSFTFNVLNPLFELLKGKIKDAAVTIFKNMTCYGGGTTNCSNFFNYIKAVLILYVMLYGAMFLLGMVKINQQDLVIRIAKIAIVSGLMNESTFRFFNEYIFDFITNFSDGIISNMSGYSMFSSTDKISNPFMFLDALMSKILFSKTFAGQVLSLLSMGLSGLIYFVILFISVIIVIITVLRAVAVYIMAFMATALLIGIAPLFLTFMLFDFTRYLFDNWVRFTFRYMIEPVILMAGIIILTQLFTIYLDFTTGYSVCWKCALPIKIPFPAIPGLPAIFSNLEIFCINWFAPWGMDPRSGMMGLNMQHYIALIIISYGMYGYVEFSGQMVAKLTSTAGPSATSMGQNMSSAMEQGALKKVGLDKQGRDAIKQDASKRLKDRNKALDKGNKARSKIDTKDSDGNNKAESSNNSEGGGESASNTSPK